MLVGILTIVAGITTYIGLSVLHGEHLTVEDRYDSDAQKRVNTAAQAISHQIVFYQRMLHALSTNTEVRALFDFGNVRDSTRWSKAIRDMMPDTLGSALADTKGIVFGEPASLGVGKSCRSDLHKFSRNEPINYPPIHTSTTGREHFDLMVKTYDDAGEYIGIVFVSFKLSVLKGIMSSLSQASSRWDLTDHTGAIVLSNGVVPKGETRIYESKIPHTNWSLHLSLPKHNSGSLYFKIALLNGIVLIFAGLLIAVLLRYLLRLFRDDMKRVQDALNDVLNERFEPSNKKARLQETTYILPKIEDMAARLQQEKEQLKRETLTDPLTGLSNRRYFDLMFKHEYDRSMRNPPAILAIIDLNGFKAVNDNLGHDRGDQLLIKVSEFLVSTIRSSDSVMRIGGDEFALILYNMPQKHLDEWLAIISERFDAFMSSSYSEITCSLSIGATTIDGNFFDNRRAVFSAADNAMYQAKTSNKNGSRYIIQATDKKLNK